MVVSPNTYCIDTSALVQLADWRPLKRHRDIWKKMEDLIEDDRLIAPRQVLEELHAVDDALTDWARKHKSMFKRPSSELTRLAKDILRQFPELATPNAPRDIADPFVVALARQRSTDLFEKVIVVTQEKYAPGRTRIPHVCEAYNLNYLSIHQMFLEERWKL